METRRLQPFLLLPRRALLWIALFSLCRAEGNDDVDAVSAMYVFGDATADVGNNNFLPGDASSKANYPPNGVDYPGGAATGRFSNGYNSKDYLAKLMRLAHSPPAALSVTGVCDELNGVNYASGKSGILDATFENVSLSMNEQVDLFRQTVGRLEKFRGKPANDDQLRRSLFVFSTGIRDLFEHFRCTGAGDPTQNEKFVADLVAAFTAQLKSLYDTGARKFGVFNAGPIGCPPALRQLSPAGDCVGPLNDLAKSFNLALSCALRDLQAASPGMSYSIADSYEIISAVLADPAQFGIKDVASACWRPGVGKEAEDNSSAAAAAYLCPDRDCYLYWDSTHLTQRGYKILADYAFEGSPRFAAPVNFKKLVLC